MVSLIGGMLRDPEVMELAILEGMDGALGLVPDLARKDGLDSRNHLMAMCVGVLLDLAFGLEADARITAFQGLLALQSWRRAMCKGGLYQALNVSRRTPETAARQLTSDQLLLDGQPVAVALWPYWLDTLLDSPNQWVLLAKEATQPGLLDEEASTCLKSLRVPYQEARLKRMSLSLRTPKEGRSAMSDLLNCAGILDWAPRLMLSHDDGMAAAHRVLQFDFDRPPFAAPFWPAFGGDLLQAILDQRQDHPAINLAKILEAQLLDRRDWCLPVCETSPWVELLKAHGAGESEAWRISVSLAAGWREALAGCTLDLSAGVGPKAIHLDESWRTWAREAWEVS